MCPRPQTSLDCDVSIGNKNELGLHCYEKESLWRINHNIWKHIKFEIKCNERNRIHWVKGKKYFVAVKNETAHWVNYRKISLTEKWTIPNWIRILIHCLIFMLSC
jgi:hypothetical protein